MTTRGAVAGVMAVVAAGLAPSEARADQCQVVTEAQAAAAVARLNASRIFMRLCEPCGEHLGDHRPEIVRAAVAVPDGDGNSRVMVNGAEIDLAYIYIRTGATTLTNLARVSGCETQSVSPSISLPPAPASAEAPTEAPRPAAGQLATITSCALRRTGFLGMGAGREADVGLVNQTEAARAFTVRVYVLYPGNGRELAAVSAVATTPGVPATARVRFRARAGMTSVQCEIAQ